MKLKPTNVVVGMKVSLNQLDDGQVYDVESIAGFIVSLSYTVKGQKLDAGVTDKSLCYNPNAKQLANWKAEQ